MDYHIYWHDPDQRMLILQVMGDLSWEDFHHMVDEAHGLIGQQPHEVHLLIWHQDGSMPPGNPLSQFHSVIRRQPPNIGRVIVVNDDLDSTVGRFMLMLASILRRVLPEVMNVQLVAHFDDALRLLDPNATLPFRMEE